MSDLTNLPAHALAARIAARDVSCREVMTAFLARIDAVNPVFNAIVSRRPDADLLAEADARDAELARDPATPRSFLFGLPQAIKDVATTAGIATTFGSPILAANVPKVDGLMAARMRGAGCIVVGKTNVPEFGLGSHTFNTVFGATRNAYDPTRAAGGSSGGAAVALAMRMLPVADGSDSMGSLRNPAAWNNVYGFRPSQGRVPSWPAHDAWVTHFGTEGPMGRTVRDVALLLDVQAGYDPRAPLSLASEPSFAARLVPGDRLNGGRPIRIGWLGDWEGHLAMDPGLLATVRAALGRLETAGLAVVEPIAMGFDPDRLWRAWMMWRHWLVRDRIGVHLAADPANRARIKPEALWEHDQGESLTASDVMDASAERTRFHEAMLALFDRVDMVASSTTQVWPFPVEWRWPQAIAAGRWTPTTAGWKRSCPRPSPACRRSACRPAFRHTGLPAGLQLVGPPRGDLAVLRVAAAYEKLAADILAVRPPLPGLDSTGAP
jgi:amidase